MFDLVKIDLWWFSLYVWKCSWSNTYHQRGEMERSKKKELSGGRGAVALKEARASYVPWWRVSQPLCGADHELKGARKPRCHHDLLLALFGSIKSRVTWTPEYSLLWSRFTNVELVTHLVQWLLRPKQQRFQEVEKHLINCTGVRGLGTQIWQNTNFECLRIEYYVQCRHLFANLPFSSHLERMALYLLAQGFPIYSFTVIVVKLTIFLFYSHLFYGLVSQIVGIEILEPFHRSSRCNVNARLNEPKTSPSTVHNAVLLASRLECSSVLYKFSRVLPSIFDR